MSGRVLLVMGSGEAGGGLTHLATLVPALLGRGWTCDVAIDGAGPGAARLAALGATVQSVPFMRRRLDPRTLVALSSVIGRCRPDVVHAHGTRAAVAAAALSRLRRAPPLVYTEHGLAGDVERNRLATALAVRAERFAVRSSAAVIALSERARAVIVRLDPSAESRTQVVPNAVTLSPSRRARDDVRRELGADGGRLVVGGVLRLVEQKGPLAWIDVARAVRTARPDTLFVVAGDGPLRDAAARHNAVCGAPAALLGLRDDVADLLLAFDVLLSTSVWEGLPFAVLEAMGAGVPVVVPAVGGLPELVAAADAGVLVPPGDVAAATTALLRLLGDPGERRRLGENGRRFVVDRCGVGRMTDAVEAAYALARGTS